MFSWLPDVPPVLELFVLAGAAATALEVLRRVVWRPAKDFRGKIDAGMDTLLGYPAVVDPGSGTELKAATPPLALRVETLETSLQLLVENQERMLALHERLIMLEEWHAEHEQWSREKVEEIYADMTTWRQEHEALHLLANEITKRGNAK